MADRRARGDAEDRPELVDDPALIAAARHALHDEELIAAFAVDGDAAEGAARARSLIDRCPTCRELHADMVAIGSTIRAAGTSEAAGAARPVVRDFRLTPMDAARLQPGNALQRAAARLRAGAAMFGRPVGASLATLGLVGLLVGTMGLGELRGATAGAAAGAPQTESLGAAAASTAPAPGVTFDVLGAGPVASDSIGRNNAGPIATSDGDKDAAADQATNAASGTAIIEVLFAVSILLLVVGLALLLTGYRHARAWGRARLPR